MARGFSEWRMLRHAPLRIDDDDYQDTTLLCVIILLVRYSERFETLLIFEIFVCNGAVGLAIGGGAGEIIITA